MSAETVQPDNAVSEMDALAALVTDALRASDALQLWDVSIGLDRARLAIQKLRGESDPPIDPAEAELAFAAPADAAAPTP